MTRPDPIPVEDLFGTLEYARATISPDGTRIAYLTPWKNRLNVWVQDLDPSGADRGEPRCVTADETRSVTHYEWTHDPRWLLYTQDSGGDENHHLFRVDLDDPDAPAVDLTPYPGARVLGHEQPHGRPGTVLLQINHRKVDEVDLVELDVATGEMTVLAENPGDVAVWMVTPDRELLAVVPAEGGTTLARWNDGVPDPVVVFSGDDFPLGVAPLELTADGTGVYAGSFTAGDHMRLVRIDLATGEETDVDGHPSADLDGMRRAVARIGSPVVRHPRTGALLGARYIGARQTIHALDPHFADVLARIEGLSDGDVGELTCDDEGRRWVVTFVHDREPGATWFYDRDTGTTRLLSRSSLPQLDPSSLAPMTPVTIPARDGLPVPAYLTLPVGAEPVGLPTVLLVHGGPWYRDAWGFDPQVQLLANRGYAVLQVDFRGSTGHGTAHMQAAIGEFAGAMHDDLVDAVDWAVGQGYTDPDRVGIMGGSYGGYAALVAVTFTPDVFAAAVDYVGISDLEDFMRTVPAFARKHLANNFHRYVGDPDTPAGAEQARARSPIHRVDAIRTPLMVAQGANDVRVPRSQSDTIVSALRGRGIDVEYLCKDDEGHGFLNPENQIDFHRTAERFLGRHLGGRVGT